MITLIDRTLSREIGARGTRLNVTLKGIHAPEKLYLNCEKIQFDIQGEWDRYEIRQAIAIRDLNLPIQSISEKIANYAEVNTGTKLKSYLNARPRVLIGQDNWPFIVTRELRAIRNADCVVSRCLLGWTIHGNAEKYPKEKNRILSSYATQQGLSEDEPNNQETLDALVRRYFVLTLLVATN